MQEKVSARTFCPRLTCRQWTGAMHVQLALLALWTEFELLEAERAGFRQGFTVLTVGERGWGVGVCTRPRRHACCSFIDIRICVLANVLPEGEGVSSSSVIHDSFVRRGLRMRWASTSCGCICGYRGSTEVV